MLNIKLLIASYWNGSTNESIRKHEAFDKLKELRSSLRNCPQFLFQNIERFCHSTSKIFQSLC